MNYLKTVLLLTALTVLFVWVGKMIGGQNGMAIALVLAVLMNGVSYWFSDKIVLKMYHAQPVDAAQAPELHGMVRELTAVAKLPMPTLYIMENPMPNAFATGRDPEHAAVAVTTGLMSLLSQREVRGVLAHELAHVKNRDILISTIAASVAGAVMMLANLAQMAAWFGFGSSEDDENGGPGIAGLLIAMIVAPLAATIIQMAISRSREYAADATGAHISRDPRALSCALQQLEQGAAMTPADVRPSTAHMFIVNPLHGGLMGLFSTHPPIPERVKRLEAMAS
ncbi:MAG TPA: zinc metalloprotease HtpX [Armatimonadota bacterium]|jgi:heat shock protein HtpX